MKQIPESFELRYHIWSSNMSRCLEQGSKTGIQLPEDIREGFGMKASSVRKRKYWIAFARPQVAKGEMKAHSALTACAERLARYGR